MIDYIIRRYLYVVRVAYCWYQGYWPLKDWWWSAWVAREKYEKYPFSQTVSWIIFSVIFSTLGLKQIVYHFADNIFKCIFMKISYDLWILFHWNMFVRVLWAKHSQYWFMLCLNYLNQCCPRSVMPYGICRPQWVNFGPYTMYVCSFLMLN